MSDKLQQIYFSGWDDSSTNSTETPPRAQGQVSVTDWYGPLYQNMRRRVGKSIVRGGQAIVGQQYTDCQMLYWAKIGNQEYRLVVDNGSVKDDITGSTLTGGASRFTPGIECNAVWFQGQVIIGNGLDPNVRFNGLTVTQLTVQPCDTSTMVVTGGHTGNPVGTFRYVVKFLNADGFEGNIAGLDTGNPLYSPSITVSGQQIQLSSIPICPAGQDCSARNIYRTKDLGTGSPGSFFLVTTLHDNTTSVYTDNLADNFLGLQMENLNFPNTAFPPCRYWSASLGRVFGAGCYTTDSNLYSFHVSDNNDPTVCRVSTDPASAFMGLRFSLPSRAAGEIRAISEPYGSVILIFTGGEVFQFGGDDNTNFFVQPYAPHGCSSHKTIARYQTSLLWLAPDGVYSYVETSQAAFTGTSFHRISDSVRNALDGLSAVDKANASAVIADGRYYLFVGNKSLICDLYYDGSWYEDTPNHFRLATSSVFTSDRLPRIYGVNVADNKVWQLETGTTDNNIAIPCRVRSSDLSLLGPQSNARVTYFGGTFRSCSDTVSGTLYTWSTFPLYTATLQLTNSSLPTLPFDASVYQPNTVKMRNRVPQGNEIYMDNNSYCWALEFGCDSTSGQFEILEGSLELNDATTKNNWNG